MYPLLEFTKKLYEYLTGDENVKGHIIRRHSKKLDELGDLSFPLNIKNWTNAIDRTLSESYSTIFDYKHSGIELERQIEMLLQFSEKWLFKIEKYTIKNGNDLHFFLYRPSAIEYALKVIEKEGDKYGLLNKCFDTKVAINTDKISTDINEIPLTEFRLNVITMVAMNILDNLATNKDAIKDKITLKINGNTKEKNIIICGPVLNESGQKDDKTKAADLIKRRTLDMQLMAQHKYGVRLKDNGSKYFERLGRACITVEMLQNKVHKATKISLNNIQAVQKEPSFIFYNCARVHALLRQFNERIINKMYPELPNIDEIDFSLLSQPEEWEICYVYVSQFPLMLIDCVGDIGNCTLNLHNMISFLSNLSSIFSVYYRRVKILSIPKSHTLPVLYARIYLIKAIQQVYDTSLKLLNIQPIKEM